MVLRMGNLMRVDSFMHSKSSHPFVPRGEDSLVRFEGFA